ncbi:hypothetical protein ACFFX0_26960 [Citricoccus parietis]|uniref:Uncharacterized protein n=1 Tax=Citricoccus parietis TaxID=592307 RepID=A0ABV5G6V9_9MICC
MTAGPAQHGLPPGRPANSPAVVWPGTNPRCPWQRRTSTTPARSPPSRDARWTGCEWGSSASPPAPVPAGIRPCSGWSAPSRNEDITAPWCSTTPSPGAWAATSR